MLKKMAEKCWGIILKRSWKRKGGYPLLRNHTKKYLFCDTVHLFISTNTLLVRIRLLAVWIWLSFLKCILNPSRFLNSFVKAVTNKPFNKKQVIPFIWLTEMCVRYSRRTPRRLATMAAAEGAPHTAPAPLVVPRPPSHPASSGATWGQTSAR